MTDLAAFAKKARGGRVPIIAAAAGLLVVGGWFARDRVFSTASASRKETASISATSKQSGVKLVMDGKEIGTLPQELTGLTPGEHQLVFESGDRYERKTTTINIAPNEKKELDDVSLHVKKGAASFDVQTPGAALALVSSDERRALSDPSPTVDVDTSKSWTLEATKSGYKQLRMPVTFEDQAAKTFTVSLEPEPAAAEVASAPANAAPQSDPNPPSNAPSKTTPAMVAARGPASSPAREARPAAAPAVVPAAASTGSGGCTLNLNSIPASRVVLDGRPLGATPRMGISTSPGNHAILFVSVNGAKKSTAATCKAGETKTVAVKLPKT